MNDGAAHIKEASARRGAAPVYINGRFLCAPARGVQRVARELTLAIDGVLAEQAQNIQEPWRLIAPKAAPALGLNAIAEHRAGPSRGALWEQIYLPYAARDGLLVNLCNVAPLAHSANIVHFHDAQVYEAADSYSSAFRAWYKFLQPRLAKRASAVTSVSTFSADGLARHGVAPRRAILVAHNGVDHMLKIKPDLSVLARNSLTPRKYFLAFASAQPHKNTALLLDAFRAAALDGYALALVGADLPPGADAAQPGVTLLGKIDDAQLRALYENAVALLFPSLTEGFGLPPGEAMSCGCPVICAPAGAVAEVYDGAALMLDPTRADDWTVAIRDIATSPLFRETWARRAAPLVSNLTWKKAAEAYVDLVRRCAQAKRTPVTPA